MDIFAHGLWANAVFYKKYKSDWKSRLWAVVFGVLPDLVSFAPLFIYAFLSRSGFWNLVSRNIWIVKYASESYNYTHSFILFTLIALVVFIIKRKIWWPMWGWLLHIMIDIFTHHGFYETPFLFPISDYRFSHGISWGTPWFMILNYATLAIIYVVIFYLSRRNITPLALGSPSQAHLLP